MPDNTTLLAHDDEAIIALSSGSLPCAIAILRLSGRNCHELAKPFIRSKKIEAKIKTKSQQMALCDLVDPIDQSIIDKPLCTYFFGPKSFTGQDSIEIHLHGGTFIVQKTLSLLLAGGFRAAEPGEFTRRAFLNGKVDLTEAEGIRELIEANSEQQWLAAKDLAHGHLRKSIESLRKRIMEAMAWLEARIDFPDEKETSDVELEEVDLRVQSVKANIKQLVSTYESGQIGIGGLKVALFGKANAGKSTLMNAFLGNDRAIVTPIAGTTRDYLEEACLINGRYFRIIDTAGVRKTSCEIEQIGIERSIQIATNADIVLHLISADLDIDKVNEEIESTKRLQHPRLLRVLTKIDLGVPSWWSEISGTDDLQLTLVRGVESEMTQLRTFLSSQLDGHLQTLKEQTCISSARHKDALDRALKAISRFELGRKNHAFDEILAFELQGVARALLGMIGAVENDEILGLIFGQFCVGK